MISRHSNWFTRLKQLSFDSLKTKQSPKNLPTSSFDQYVYAQ